MASGLTETPLLPLLGAPRRDSSAFVPQNCNTNQFLRQITCLNSSLACNIPSALPFCLLSVIAFHIFLRLYLSILHTFCPFLFLLRLSLALSFPSCCLFLPLSLRFLSLLSPCQTPFLSPFSPIEIFFFPIQKQSE